MEKVMFVQVGMGIDLHGQDQTQAAVRAVRDAIGRNSMPGLRSVLPDGDIGRMQVRVTLGVPWPSEPLNVEAIKQVLPYGQVELSVLQGGMVASSGAILPDKGDKTDEMLIVNAVVEVGY